MLHHVRVYPSRLNLASYCDKISVDYTVIKLLLYTEGYTLTKPEQLEFTKQSHERSVNMKNEFN